jgi:NifU-like protein involved in Fe-S cluster formation
MSNDPYSARVHELFDSPAHAGRLEGALSVVLDEQGVRVYLAAETAGGQVQALRFQAWGCPHFIAAAEEFCGSFEGRPDSDLLEFSAADLMQSLSVPVEKSGRILVLEDAVRSLGSIIRDASRQDT